uniref:Uncharacterized protein n=1 Tax=Rhizophora mucronata TaxID=61149 RepID=A0A2P2Q9K9_RHIMU
MIESERENYKAFVERTIRVFSFKEALLKFNAESHTALIRNSLL